MISLPEQLSCDDCNTGKERLIHWAVSAGVEGPGAEPDGPWSWEILNHDKTSRFKWPYEFDTKDAAWAHIYGIIETAKEEVAKEAKEALEGDTVV